MPTFTELLSEWLEMRQEEDNIPLYRRPSFRAQKEELEKQINEMVQGAPKIFKGKLK